MISLQQVSEAHGGGGVGAHRGSASAETQRTQKWLKATGRRRKWSRKKEMTFSILIYLFYLKIFRKFKFNFETNIKRF